MNHYLRFGYVHHENDLSLTKFFLLKGDKSGIEFSVDMTDLTERWEEGVITIRKLADSNLKKTFPLPSTLRNRINASLMILDTEYGGVETGIELSGEGSSKILLVAATTPYELAVYIEPNVALPTGFSPNYKQTELRRESL